MKMIYVVTCVMIWVVASHLSCEDGFVQGLPISYTVSITPDVSPYEVGSEVTIDFSFCLDISQPEENWKGLQFAVVIEDSIGTIYREGADKQLISRPNSNALLIDEKNSSMTGHLTFRFLEESGSVSYSVNVYRLSNDPAYHNYPIYIGSDLCYDNFYFVIFRSKEWMKTNREFESQPGRLPDDISAP